ncbi:uncharacterized protein CIMG_07377 [Coccidioides immitis RS]|uniref:Uncharacterized protein n=1 Tax=Coccidioides immitis (strain RS) TaxID=246410 RepID=J3KA78_COCIM|nr:uncharacterized protein CIMG_07377 [Coccidioides immitis RS]EAS31898.3 hypothetical protein CIMG_07377 [Coccidioides immitis RS]
MSLTVGLYVIIFDDGGVYKHWSLFIDGPTDAEKIILHVMSSSTRYCFDMRNSNTHKSATLLEMIHLCNMDTSKISMIKNVAKKWLSIMNIWAITVRTMSLTFWMT